MQPKTNTRFARANEAERIQNVLNEWIAAPVNAGGLTVLGVSGYGGVGKSFLLNSVLNEKKLENRDALVIRIDGGNNRLLTDFMGFVDEKLAPKMVRFKGSNPKDDQFPETRKLVSHQRKLAAKVVAEVEASDLPKNVKNAAKALYRFNPLISKIPEVGPAISKLLELGEKFKVEEYAEPAIELLSGLKSLKPSNGLFGKKLHLSPLERLAISPLETYDANGQPDITTAPGGFVTNEDYDARGNLQTVTDPNGRETAYVHNKRRQVTDTTADQAGIAAATAATYDNQGRTATLTPPADNAGQRPQQATTYTATDKIRLAKLAGTTLSDTAYDSRDWSASESDAAGRATQFIRHANGDMNETRKPGSRTSVFQYDGDNRLTASSNPGSNSGIRNAALQYGTTQSGYPGTLSTEADGLQTLSEFDRMGRLRFFTDRGFNTYEFRYDALGRRTHSIPPQSQPTLTEYTGNGRIAKLTESSGDTATYAYHPTTGRPASVTYSGTGGGTVNYTSHDNNGNLLSVNENGANAIGRTYDGLNRVTSYTFGGQTIGYRYYPSGKLAKLIYPGGSENGTGHVEYTYDSNGRLYQVIDKLDSTSSPRTTTYRRSSAAWWQCR